VILPYDERNRFRLMDRDHVPTLHIRADAIENVSGIVRAAESWLADRYPENQDDFTIASSTARVNQATQAMLVFKLALGSIAAISLIVGGIGIMNILLASVTERTREIGIRRASGARRGHILAQFLSESIMISIAGSLAGALLGIGATYVVTFGIEALTEAPISAVFSVGSLLFAAATAVLIGLVFGTYPARRAADIEPAVAMRYE
jgi:putative ABC transport system permease protein